MASWACRTRICRGYWRLTAPTSRGGAFDDALLPTRPHPSRPFAEPSRRVEGSEPGQLRAWPGPARWRWQVGSARTTFVSPRVQQPPGANLGAARETATTLARHLRSSRETTTTPARRNVERHETATTPAQANPAVSPRQPCAGAAAVSHCPTLAPSRGGRGVTGAATRAPPPATGLTNTPDVHTGDASHQPHAHTSQRNPTNQAQPNQSGATQPIRRNPPGGKQTHPLAFATHLPRTLTQ